MFMGEDSCLREEIMKQLGSESRRCYAEDFQQVCLDKKKVFLDWIAELGEQQDKSFWWGTNIAYKSPLASSTFLNYCFVSLIQKWIEQDIKKIIIILENPWLVKACSKNFHNQNICIIDNHKHFIKTWVKCQFVSYAKLFFFLPRSMNMWIINKAYTLKYNKQVTTILRNRIDVLTCTWVEDRSFKSGNGIFVDPYLGNLRDYYKNKGLETIAITLPIFPSHILKKVYRSKEIIPSIYFVGLSDIAKSFFKTLFLKWNKQIPHSSGLDLTPVFEYETITEKCSVCYALLHYYVCLKLFKSRNMPCRALVYPFEDQPWDKMMVLAMQQAQTGCKAIGYQHSTISPFLLNYFLGENESNTHPQPSIIISNGEYWGAVLRNAGFTCPVKNGGSLRFGSNANSDETETSSIGNDRGNNVLVLLSASLNYSLDLLFYLLRSAPGGKNFLLKPHPDVPEKTIKKYIRELPDNFVFVGGSMNECMSQVAWAVHVGTTAAIECMMQGIRVFKYLPERIDLDPLLGLDFKQHVVTDKDVLNFNKMWTVKVPDNSLMAESFNEATWEEILK